MHKFIFIVFASAIINGCALLFPDDLSTVPESNEAKLMLDNTAPCCGSLAEIKYKPLAKGFKGTFYIDGSEQLFDFKSGKSFFEAFSLPETQSGYGILVESIITDKGVFAPDLVLLDRGFRAVQVIPADAFIYIPASGFAQDRLSYTLNIEPALGARYMLILTTDEARSKTTQYVHPARTYARAQNLADPGIPDPYAVHSPVGMLAMQVSATYLTPANEQRDVVESWLASFWGTSEPAATKPSVADAEAIARSVPDSSSPVIASAAVVTTAAAAPVATAAPGTMMAETEAMYNQMITQAVAGRDIDKAMKLVEEAERAGSASARKTFVEEVKKLK